MATNRRNMVFLIKVDNGEHNGLYIYHRDGLIGTPKEHKFKQAHTSFSPFYVLGFASYTRKIKMLTGPNASKLKDGTHRSNQHSPSYLE